MAYLPFISASFGIVGSIILYFAVKHGQKKKDNEDFALQQANLQIAQNNKIRQQDINSERLYNAFKEKLKDPLPSDGVIRLSKDSGNSTKS